jgi:hypothetical protein
MATKVSPAVVNAPTTTDLLELLVRLHADVRQIQYPYSAKILKWGIISDSEIESALKDDPNASEQSVWTGERPADVAVRIAGGLTAFIDSDGYRQTWVQAGLAEGSWKNFLEQYCMLKASPLPFNDTAYYRDFEMDNLSTLVAILDEEIFSNAAMKGPTRLSVSFKSKWWKECHRVFSDAVQEAVYRHLSLNYRPKWGLCYTPEWTDPLKAEIREIAKRWTTCPLWDRPQGTNPTEVDFTSNNEATVKMYLDRNSFTTHYLEGR